MYLSLFIILIISLVVLLVCYLLIVARSFKHHSVTGLISLIPIVNLLIIPSVWYQIRKPFFISIIAIIIAAIAWFSGGQHYTATLGQKTLLNQSDNYKAVSSNINTVPLPPKALYHIGYKPISISSIPQTIDQHIRITFANGSQLKGRNQSVNKATLQLLVGYNDEQQIIEVSLRNIKKLERLNDQQ